MFRDVMEQLARGEMPDKKGLAGKLGAALTKKIGVLQIPFLCRPADPKINPPARHLLVVAALLADGEKIRLALDILQTELAQQNGKAAAEDVCLALSEAKEATSLLLSAFPEELAFWERLTEVQEHKNTRKSGEAMSCK